MSDRNPSAIRVLVAACIGVALLSACAPREAASPGGNLVPFNTSAAPSCVPQEIPPTITEVEPAEITPGSEVSVSARGGYLKDSCGGYNESARTYPIYLDDEPAGELVCYVNHCEGKFKLPERAAVGRHCLGVQKGTCQMELHVVEN